jgi:hypothetical protein
MFEVYSGDGFIEFVTDIVPISTDIFELPGNAEELIACIYVL